MFHVFFRFKAAIRIQSFLNPYRKCHHQTNPPLPSYPFIQYLENSLGLSPEKALKILKQLRGYKPRNPAAPVSFFKSHGLSTIQVQSMIYRTPSLLSYASPQSSLGPKVQFFKENGISEYDLQELMVSSPALFTHSLEGCIKPLIDLLRSILGSNENAVQLLIRSKVVFNPEVLSSNISILRCSGVQSQHISKLLMRQPQVLGDVYGPFNEGVETIKAIGGFRPQSYSSFVEAVATVVSLSRQKLDAKFKIYTSLGWSSEEALSLFRKQPLLMRLSEEKIRKNFDYLTKELGWGCPYILIHPTLLFLSLDKRLVPRHRLLQFLASKGYIKKDKISATSFLLGNNNFLKNFVVRYELEVPDIMKIYEGLMGSKVLNIRDGEDHSVQ